MPNCCAYYKRVWKRLFDLCAAFLGIVIVSPFLLAITFILKLGGAGRVIYYQQRVGRNFQPFYICKFRTMRPGSDADGNTCTVKGDARVTPIGRFLRKTKLDELPQLLNVIKGDMSLVGPRPEVPQYVEMFREDYETVLSVRPGITDYAAIEYRDEESILVRYTDPREAYAREILPAKIKLYKKYIVEQSFLTDLKIIMRTLRELVR